MPQPDEAKREAAKLRAEARSKRTHAQQLARLDQLGHTARKERARLAKLLKKEATK